MKMTCSELCLRSRGASRVEGACVLATEFPDMIVAAVSLSGLICRPSRDNLAASLSMLDIIDS